MPRIKQPNEWLSAERFNDKRLAVVQLSSLWRERVSIITNRQSIARYYRTIIDATTPSVVSWQQQLILGVPTERPTTWRSTRDPPRRRQWQVSDAPSEAAQSHPGKHGTAAETIITPSRIDTHREPHRQQSHVWKVRSTGDTINDRQITSDLSITCATI